MKKYEFTGEVVCIFGKTLKRIRALVELDLGFTVVKVGDVGGWIETEYNLSHNGTAWVFDNAKVFGNGRIYDNAWISDNVWVYDHAWVCGNACVSGKACISGKAWVCGNAEVQTSTHVLTVGPLGSRHGTTTFFRSADENIKVRCGCFYGTIDEFLAKVQETHGDNKHAQAYRMAAELAKLQINTD